MVELSLYFVWRWKNGRVAANSQLYISKKMKLLDNKSESQMADCSQVLYAEHTSIVENSTVIRVIPAVARDCNCGTWR